MIAVLIIGGMLVILTGILAVRSVTFWSLPVTVATATVLFAGLVYFGVPWWAYLTFGFASVIFIAGSFLFGLMMTRWLYAAIFVVITAIALPVAFVATGSPKATGSSAVSPTTTPSASTSATTLNAKAANWVRSMTLNFAGVAELPAKCQNYVPSVDLTQIHWYARDGAKESPDAFGTSMGDNPCDISINRVERAYRDPFYVLQKANEIKAVDPSFDFVPYTPDQQAARVTELQNAPFAEREALADKVLGWYSDPSRVLKIDQVTGAYTSSGASSVGGVVTTVASSANKSSTVVTAYDRKTGAVQKQDRANCGDQPYKPAPPITTPPTTPPITTPPTLEKKVPSQDPAPRGNAPVGGGKNVDPGPGAYIPPAQMTQPPAAPYTPPAAPKATQPPVGSTSDPAPAPAPQTSAPPPTAPATGCAPPPGMTTC